MSQNNYLFKEGISSLLLSLLVQQSMYGYQILKELERKSAGYFNYKEGTLYPVLHRLEKSGLLSSNWQLLTNGRQRKYYSITPKGQQHLEEKRVQWHDFFTAINLLIRPKAF